MMTADYSLASSIMSGCLKKNCRYLAADYDDRSGILYNLIINIQSILLFPFSLFYD